MNIRREEWPDRQSQCSCGVVVEMGAVVTMMCGMRSKSDVQILSCRACLADSRTTLAAVKAKAGDFVTFATPAK